MTDISEQIGFSEQFKNERGQLHREGGLPASIINNEYGLMVGYCENGLFHRDPSVGPAFQQTYPDGSIYKEYRINGRLHREDGPAIDYVDRPGRLIYALNGSQYDKEEYDKEVAKLKSSRKTKDRYPEVCLHNINNSDVEFIFRNESGDFHRNWWEGPASYQKNKAGWIKYYISNSEYHRLDGPAYETNDYKEYWIDGKFLSKEEFEKENVLHPEYQNSYLKGRTVHSNRVVWRNDEGQLHRENGPAIIDNDGSFWYCKNGKFSRDPAEGPAIYTVGIFDGQAFWRKSYMLDGKLHREDGPAYETSKGEKEYYLNGVKYDGKTSFEAKLENMNGGLLTVNPGTIEGVENMVGEKDNTVLKLVDTKAIRFQDAQGRLHREGGPAYYDLSTKGYSFYKHGRITRDPWEGPAMVIWPLEKDGCVKYIVDGSNHREDGPAIIYNDGREEYWLNDSFYTKEDWERLRPKEVLQESLKGAATRRVLDSYIVYEDQDGNYHREGAPAVIYDTGSVYYYKHGKAHNENGPAQVVYNLVNGSVNESYWLDGIGYSKENYDIEIEKRNQAKALRKEIEEINRFRKEIEERLKMKEKTGKTETRWIGIISDESVNIVKAECEVGVSESDLYDLAETLANDLADAGSIDGWDAYNTDIAIKDDEWLAFATEAVEYIGPDFAIGLPRKFNLVELANHPSVNIMDQNGVDLTNEYKDKTEKEILREVVSKLSAAQVGRPDFVRDVVEENYPEYESEYLEENNWVFGTDSLGNAWAIRMDGITEEDLSQRLDKMTKAGFLPSDEAGHWTSIFYEDAYNAFREAAIDGELGLWRPLDSAWVLSERFTIADWATQCKYNGLTPNVISEFGYNYLTGTNLEKPQPKNVESFILDKDINSWKVYSDWKTDNVIRILPLEQTLDKKQENKKMDMSMVKETLKASAKDVGGAAKLGVALEAVERTNDFVYNQLVELASKHLGVDKEKMQEPLVKETILSLLPVLLHPTAVMMEGKVPYANKAKTFAEHSITVASKRNAGMLMETLENFFKMFTMMNSSEEKKITFSVDYSKLTRPKLRIMAAEKGLRVSTKTNKDELIELLQEKELIEQGLLEVDEERVIA